MGDLTKEIPKPMIKVGNKPILEHQIELLSRYKVTDIIILVNYLKEPLIDYFGDGSKWHVKLSYFEEEEPLGTVGGIKEIEDQLTEDFLVFYGDVMIDMHIGKLIDFHTLKQSDCTLVLHPNDHPFDSDLVETDKNDKVVAFHSKPHAEGLFYKNLVNAGTYILSPRVLSFLEKGKKADFGRHIFPAIYNKLKMFGYNTTEYLKDMGTPERLQEVEKAFQTGKIRRSNYEFKQKAIFLDRDGVINEEAGLFNNPQKLKIFEFAPEAVKKINQSEYKAIVVTNQPSIAKGMATVEEAETILKKMETAFGDNGAKFDEIFYCPHHPEKGFEGERPEYKIDCECRKPKPGMLLNAAKKFNIDLNQSYIIGDTERDVLAGKNAGCYTVGVMTGFGVKKASVLPDFFFQNLSEAVDFIVDAPYEKYFQTLLDEIKPDTQKPYIIGIGGNARSGKSNLAAFLKMRFEQSNVRVMHVELDNWLLNESERKEEMNVFDRFQLLRITEDIKRLTEGCEVSVNYYPNHTERKSDIIHYKPEGKNIIIIEGVVALSSETIRSVYQKRIFVTTNDDTRRKRFDNYYTWRGKSKTEIDAIYQSRIEDEYKLIEKDRKFADLVIKN